MQKVKPGDTGKGVGAAGSQGRDSPALGTGRRVWGTPPPPDDVPLPHAGGQAHGPDRPRLPPSGRSAVPPHADCPRPTRCLPGPDRRALGGHRGAGLRSHAGVPPAETALGRGAPPPPAPRRKSRFQGGGGALAPSLAGPPLHGPSPRGHTRLVPTRARGPAAAYADAIVPDVKPTSPRKPQAPRTAASRWGHRPALVTLGSAQRNGHTGRGLGARERSVPTARRCCRPVSAAPSAGRQPQTKPSPPGARDADGALQ